ncbi:MAG: hypothetical protein KC425_20860 [Anaerolineales bacterium]|nr:hypothetical protein [Anaerolineales bacterium]
MLSLTLLLTTLTALGVGFFDTLSSWWWVWLLGGALAEAGLVYSSITDPKFGERIAAHMLRREFEPERLRDPRLQQQIKEALEYRGRIEESIRGRGDSLIKDELTQTGVQIDEWLEHIYGLARRIDRYRQEEKRLLRDLQVAQGRIRELRAEMGEEQDTAVKNQMAMTLQALQRQVDTLENLANTIQRAELQLENTLTSLRTIYSQSMLVEAKDIDSSRARRLRHEITEEVTELNDILVAMDEVYAVENSAVG